MWMTLAHEAMKMGYVVTTNESNIGVHDHLYCASRPDLVAYHPKSYVPL